MKINFHQPPGAGSLGGLEQAVSLMCKHLAAAGVSVQRGEGHVKDKCDLHHFHGLWQTSWPVKARALERGGVPYVISPHGMLEPWAMNHKAWKKWPYYWLVEKRFLSGAACLFATSTMEAGHIAKLLPDSRIESIPLGLASGEQQAYHEARSRLGFWKKPVLLFLSRIHPKKGLDLLLQALVEMKDPRLVDCQLVVVGGGEERYLKKLKSFCFTHAKRLPAISWAGEIWGDAKWDYLKGADLFCLPSHSENFGMAVLESMQVGTPVLTTDRTPWGEYAGSEGFYIGTPDAGSVCQGLLDWLDSGGWTEEQRHKMASETHKRFNWSRLVPQYMDVYGDVTALKIKKSAA